MRVIITTYLRPTNHRGSRIKATAGKLTATIAWDYSLDTMLNHYEAVKALQKKHHAEILWDISDMGYGSDENHYYFTSKFATTGVTA